MVNQKFIHAIPKDNELFEIAYKISVHNGLDKPEAYNLFEDFNFDDDVIIKEVTIISSIDQAQPRFWK